VRDGKEMNNRYTDYTDINHAYIQALRGAESGTGIYAHEYRMLENNIDEKVMNIELDSIRNVGIAYVNDVLEEKNFDRMQRLFSYFNSLADSGIKPFEWFDKKDIVPIDGRTDYMGAHAEKILVKFSNNFNSGIAEGLKARGYAQKK
jgi:hypothetical protein